MAMMQSISNDTEMPKNLQGSILLDQTYAVPSTGNNLYHFAPNAQFRIALVDMQGTTDFHEGPWMWNLLAQNVNTFDLTNVVDKDHMLEALKTEHQSDWELATAYFWNFPIVSAALVILVSHFVQAMFPIEYIDDIQVLPPSLSSVGSPQLLVVLRKGWGLDIRQGAKSQDEGRLRFYFISYVSFNVASRTIMALWRTRTLTLDQKFQIAKEQQEEDGKSVLLEVNGSCLVIEDVSSLLCRTACRIPDFQEDNVIDSCPRIVQMKLLLEMFEAGDLEYKVMGNFCCQGYVTMAWEHVKPDVFERCICYKINRQFSIFVGEVTCAQLKIPLPNGKGWIVNDVLGLMALHYIMFSITSA
ncbi:hypothetical protein C3L33_00619, partial [Rhododendron williamsianum]